MNANNNECAKTKCEVQRAISANHNMYKLIENSSGKSDVWKTFKIVEFDGKPLDFVCCCKCKLVLAFSVKNGTTTLARHKCAFMPPPNQPLLNFASKAVPKNVLDDLAKKNN